jgi:hypothetical protein
MIEETRATYADIANRRHFTEQGKPIPDTRSVLTQLTAPPVTADPAVTAARSGTHMQQAADNGFIETG